MTAVPSVSVVIPTRNRPQLLMRAIASITTQNINNIEIIVVQDGPDETTRSLLSDFSDLALKVIELPVHQGMEAASTAQQDPCRSVKSLQKRERAGRIAATRIRDHACPSRRSEFHTASWTAGLWERQLWKDEDQLDSMCPKKVRT